MTTLDAPAVYPLRIERGDVYTLPVTYGSPAIDITGLDVSWTFSFIGHKTTFTPEAGLIIDGPAGLIELSLTEAQTQAFGAHIGKHRLRLNGVTLLKGSVEVED